MAQQTVGFEVTCAVAAPVGALWEVLGDFGTEHRWTRTLKHCERDTAAVAVGTSRICALPRPLMGRMNVRERLTEFEPGIALAYELEGAAGPFATASSRWSTREGPSGITLLTVEGHFTPRGWLARLVMWPLARPMIRRLTRGVMRELADFVTAGRAKGLPAPNPR